MTINNKYLAYKYIILYVVCKIRNKIPHCRVHAWPSGWVCARAKVFSNLAHKVNS